MAYISYYKTREKCSFDTLSEADPECDVLFLNRIEYDPEEIESLPGIINTSAVRIFTEPPVQSLTLGVMACSSTLLNVGLSIWTKVGKTANLDSRLLLFLLDSLCEEPLFLVLPDTTQNIIRQFIRDLPEEYSTHCQNLPYEKEYQREL